MSALGTSENTREVDGMKLRCTKGQKGEGREARRRERGEYDKGGWGKDKRRKEIRVHEREGGREGEDSFTEILRYIHLYIERPS